MSQDLSMSSLTLSVEMVTPSSAFVTRRITDTQLIQGTYGVSRAYPPHRMLNLFLHATCSRECDRRHDLSLQEIPRF